MTRELSPKAGAALLRQAFSTKNATLSHTEALDLLARLKGFEAWSHMQQSERKKKSTEEAKHKAPKHLTLVDVLRDYYGNFGEFSAFPRATWSYEVENNDTSLGYWDWVVATLEAKDLLCCDTDFTQPNPVEVTLPNGKRSTWRIETNLTDRWGSPNDFGSRHKPSLAILQLDEALALDGQLLNSLQAEMWDEQTHLARKDGIFGVLFEIEGASQESERENDEKDPDAPKRNPHAEVVRQFAKGLSLLKPHFPTIEMCVPDAQEIINDRPALWAFVPLGELADEERHELGQALMNVLNFGN